ncbi:MAG: response regulator transcription factor [Trichlorobacter sp.]|jgi:two-component system OmpR family response regulator|nr:response regulator transcription factor [Trichlorobacter sp.]
MQPPVLIVEDDLKIARVIKAYLEAADFRTAHADTASKALTLVESELPLAVVLDLGLPDRSGEELCLDLKEMGDFPVLMLTAKASEEDRIAGFSIGADDYLVKPASPRELVCRVKAVLKRYNHNNIAEAPVSFNNGELLLDNRKHAVTCRNQPCQLTPTEFKLLSTLASAPGRSWHRDELVSKALGYQFDGYERSVDAHIKNLRQKIELDSRNPQYIKTIYGIGYQFCGVPDAT